MNGVHETVRECPWRDAATLHVLGALAPEESSAYDGHLRDCGDCRGELEQARAAVAEVDLARASEDLEGGRAAAPSPRVRERLLQRLEVERAPDLDRAWRRWSSPEPVGASSAEFGPGLYAVAASAGAWEPIGIDGIDVKHLATDPARRFVSMLVRMAPGTSYPRHRHAGDEECFVVSGEVEVGGAKLRAGDYQKAAAGSVHEVQSTQTGCLLFIVSSQDDELLR
jgi:quercetin dioxygenase-like cupin family protein